MATSVAAVVVAILAKILSETTVSRVLVNAIDLSRETIAAGETVIYGIASVQEWDGDVQQLYRVLEGRYWIAHHLADPLVESSYGPAADQEIVSKKSFYSAVVGVYECEEVTVEDEAIDRDQGNVIRYPVRFRLLIDP